MNTSSSILRMSIPVHLCVLIPAYNEARVIRRTIWSCVKAGVDLADIYIVDDGSTDGTADRARTGVYSYKPGVNVLQKSNSGKADSLRQGFEHFKLADRYTHVAILDADSQLDPNYISSMQVAIDKYPDTALFCGAPRSVSHNWLTAFRAVEYAVALGIYREAQSFMGVVNVAPGCASVYRTDIFASLSFDGDTLVEDMDLTMQLQRRKEHIRYVPDAIVYTQDPATIRGFLGQVSRWYRGIWQIVRKHSIGRRVQGIDLEVGYLILESVLFSILVASIPILGHFYPRTVLLGLAVDQALLLLFTSLVAINQRRWDVLLAFPLFTIPRLINCFVFPWAYFAERHSRSLQWYSVARY